DSSAEYSRSGTGKQPAGAFGYTSAAGDCPALDVGSIGARDPGRTLERWVVIEDPLLEPLQRSAWFDSKLADKCVPRLPVASKRIRLSARAVKRKHELGA